MPGQRKSALAPSHSPCDAPKIPLHISTCSPTGSISNSRTSPLSVRTEIGFARSIGTASPSTVATNSSASGGVTCAGCSATADVSVGNSSDARAACVAVGVDVGVAVAVAVGVAVAVNVGVAVAVAVGVAVAVNVGVAVAVAVAVGVIVAVINSVVASSLDSTVVPPAVGVILIPMPGGREPNGRMRMPSSV